MTPDITEARRLADLLLSDTAGPISRISAAVMLRFMAADVERLGHWQQIANDRSVEIHRLNDEMERLRAQVAPASRLTEAEKTDLVAGWFSEDWAVDKALGLLCDYDSALKRLAASPAAPAQQAEPICIRARCATHGCDGFCERRAHDAQQATKETTHD